MDKLYHLWMCDCGHSTVTEVGELPEPHDCPHAPTPEQAKEWAENFKRLAQSTRAGLTPVMRED